MAPENLVAVCTDLSGKKLYRQVCVGRVATSESLGGVMGSILAHNTRNVGSNPALWAGWPIFITPTTHCIPERQHYKASSHEQALPHS